MKKTLILIIVGITLLSLAGCSSAQGSVTSAPASAMPGAGGNGTGKAGEMPPTLQLAIGTLKLEKTDYPIDKEQAARLLFLWKGARAVSTSDTAASEELNGLLKQIEGTLTSEQLQAIKDMNLKMSDMQALSQELGINLGMGGARSGASPAGAARSSATNPAGGPPGGGFGGGMTFGGPPGGGQLGGSRSSSNSSSTAPKQGSFMGLSASLIDQIIAYLEAKV